MKTFGTNPRTHQITVTSLAVVGFIALMALGAWFAVYSARFVPPVVDGIGAAAVYLGSVFTPASQPSPVSTASTTIPFGEATTTTPVASTTAPVLKPVVPTAGTPTTHVTLIGDSANAATTPLSGLPDLVITINSVGYLTSTTTSSFTATTTIPHGATPAVKFTVKNVGTNATGPWRWSATTPTVSSISPASIPVQQNLNPGDYIEYTFGFNDVLSGTGKVITINVNSDNAVKESNYANNTVSTTVTILGS